jgi:hypothetical protein
MSDEVLRRLHGNGAKKNPQVGFCELPGFLPHSPACPPCGSNNQERQRFAPDRTLRLAHARAPLSFPYLSRLEYARAKPSPRSTSWPPAATGAMKSRGALATLRLRSEIESTAGGHHAGAAWSRHGPDAQSVRGSLRTWCGLAAARKAQGIRIAGECALEHVIEHHITGRLRSGSIRSAAEGIDLSPR